MRKLLLLTFLLIPLLSLATDVTYDANRTMSEDLIIVSNNEDHLLEGGKSYHFESYVADDGEVFHYIDGIRADDFWWDKGLFIQLNSNIKRGGVYI